MFNNVWGILIRWMLSMFLKWLSLGLASSVRSWFVQDWFHVRDRRFILVSDWTICLVDVLVIIKKSILYIQCVTTDWFDRRNFLCTPWSSVCKGISVRFSLACFLITTTCQVWYCSPLILKEVKLRARTRMVRCCMVTNMRITEWINVLHSSLKLVMDRSSCTYCPAAVCYLGGFEAELDLIFDWKLLIINKNWLF